MVHHLTGQVNGYKTIHTMNSCKAIDVMDGHEAVRMQWMAIKPSRNKWMVVEWLKTLNGHECMPMVT